MTKAVKRVAFLFPGQGAQYPGMALDFVNQFSAARLTFEEADDLLQRPLSSLVFQGPKEELIQTKNSQVAIYVMSIALLRVIQELFEIKPFVCAGLSLGEYSALTAGQWLSFRQTLPLVQLRGQLMNEACEATNGSMAVVIGLDSTIIEEVVQAVNMPRDICIANYNCPGQIVLSGTAKGLEAATTALKDKGAKKVLLLQVHGAFHSRLMQMAEDKLSPYIQQAPIRPGESSLVMNVSGQFVSNVEQIRKNLIKQVTHSVRWEQGIHAMEEENVDLYIEMGPGNTLAGMNKRIGVKVPTLSIDKVNDLDHLSELVKKGEI